MQRLREYIVKGFALNDTLLKQAGGGDHFDELLERIRDIRSSERVFWRKVLDIYAMSEDYDPGAESSQRFFQMVQNNLTNWDGDKPRKGDVAIAKNYLNAEELHALNLIVSAYLDFAELQALDRKPMYMADWIAKLDDFIRITGRDILTHAGRISHESAKVKAELEYARYQAAQDVLPQPVDQHFAEAVKELKQIEKTTTSIRKPGKKQEGAGR